MAALAVAGCGNNDGDISSPETPKRMVRLSQQLSQPVSQAEWSVARRYFARNLRKYPNESWVFSPTSLSVCATMLREGLVGKSNQELAKVLGQQLQITSYQTAYKTLCRNYSQSGGPVRMAQAVWVREGFDVLPSYSNSVKDLYRAQVTAEAFDGNAVKHINDWAGQNTDGLIDHLIDEIGRDTVLILLQATLFHDGWQEPFEPSNNTNDNFTMSTGKKVACEMMHQFGEFSYVQLKLYQAIELPYKTGFKMRIILPEPGKKLGAVLDGMTLAVGNDLSTASGSVAIPKWTTEVSCDLMDFFKESGAERLFLSSSDFAMMSSNAEMFVSKVDQKAKIIVDEKGTKAAAVTEIEAGAAEHAPAEPFDFRADRPFAYVILSPENLPVFIGVVNDPTSQAAQLK